MPLRILRSIVCVFVLSTPACAATETTAGCAGTKADLQQAGTLTVATDVSFPPFAFRTPDGTPTGFEIDLAHDLAARMKLKILVLNRGTSELITGLRAHRHDLALSALRATDELRSEACLTEPYLNADLAVLVPRPDPHAVGGPGDLSGRTVAVLKGSRAEEWVMQHLRTSRVASLPTTDDLLEALRQKQADAVVDELAVASFAAKESPDFTVASTIVTHEHFVIAAAPDNGGLVTRVNAALAQLATNGAMSKLKRKWFGAHATSG